MVDSPVEPIEGLGLARDDFPLLAEARFGVWAGTRTRRRGGILRRSCLWGAEGEIVVRIFEQGAGRHLEERGDQVDFGNPNAALAAQDIRQPLARVSCRAREFDLRGTALLQTPQDLAPKVL